jgi:hypothetical protein
VRQPDDPGIPEGEEPNNGKPNGWRYWGLVLAAGLVVMMVLLARTAAAQDPPVPLEEICEDPAGAPIADCTIYNQAHIYAFSGDERTIRWSLVQSDVDSMELFTELKVFEFPPKGGAFPVMSAELAEAIREFGWTPTRAGTYFIEARACRTDVDDPNDENAEQHPTRGLIICSIIASSTDPTFTGDTFPRGFVMLIKVPAATGGGIE